ncbi:MAG: hypothetical protein GOMPHAMPRED_006369 [Gomphillus americanus]|uniref:Uncharacterized protein n=1 Tax=Gomphillus americanus TaxID=1940652 RepID=A0A8H3ERL7_9LECA|nr:MAG: hypothetical protein GOMPHAMPRED_006369 [Gomphillus americanus]
MPVHRLVHIYFVDLLTVYATESSGTFVTAGGLAKVFADGPALTTAISTEYRALQWIGIASMLQCLIDNQDHFKNGLRLCSPSDFDTKDKTIQATARSIRNAIVMLCLATAEQSLRDNMKLLDEKVFQERGGASPPPKAEWQAAAKQMPGKDL